MRFKGLDLNLLVALDVLVRERSVSRAATRLHLSQPAMSAALNRLREYFHDPILVPQGNRMIATPHAMHLSLRLQSFLAEADSIISASSSFDPAVARRRFRIGISDYLSIVLFSKLLPKLEKSAPGVHFDLVQPSNALATLLEQGEVDLIITLPERVSPHHPTELLFEERHVVVGWNRNPLLRKTLTEKQFWDAGHLAVWIGNHRPMSFAESHLSKLGKQRRIEISVASFALAPEMLVKTQRLAVMHERLAQIYEKRLPIAYVPMPFEFPLMQELIQYHHVGAADAGLRWLITQMRAAVNPAPRARRPRLMGADEPYRGAGVTRPVCSSRMPISPAFGPDSLRPSPGTATAPVRRISREEDPT